MKKVIWMLAAVLITAPVFAQEGPAGKVGGRPAMDQRHEAFQKAHKEQMEKMKATKEKAEKLVKEYNKLKDGKKKDAKKAEIEKLVASIREEQLSFRVGQIKKDEERLENMKKFMDDRKEILSTLQTAENKKEWVSYKTNELIETNGDLKVLFERNDGFYMDETGKKVPAEMRHAKAFSKCNDGFRIDPKTGEKLPVECPGMKDGKGPKHFGKDGGCPFAKEGKKCEGGKDCKCGKHFGKGHKGPRVGINPPPPPPLEEK
ncbi:MAG: hypothetical protein J5601_03435 [Elusimicrobiaceae bacterium]|nr:hypothetical protein [Elusimicrobiaceae bacterium]